MQKKIIALAIASALTAPAAFADTSNVTVYGVLNADFENVKSSNVGAGASNSLNRVSSNATRLGVKGTESLGDGLNAIWQLEIQADLNGNANNGFGNGTRNSNIGLKGKFGTAFLGIWDTPFKVSHNKIELFDNTTFASATNVLGRTSGAGVSFNNRLKNSVQYWTPEMSGFQAKVAYGTDNAKTTTVNQSVASLSATYENDMFYAAYAYETFKDATLNTNAATAGNKSNGNRLVGAYKFDQGLVGLTYDRLDGTTAGVSSSRNAWELAGKYSFGASNIGASYVKAGNLSGVANPSGAKQLSLRYGYSFSKRTEMYGIYSSLKNDAAANYNLSAGTAIANSAAGASLSGFGVGMVHSF
ncbi:MAG TPA: porin [Gallionella sp.]|nr:porin [Gallionella sp.]